MKTNLSSSVGALSSEAFVGVWVMIGTLISTVWVHRVLGTPVGLCKGDLNPRICFRPHGGNKANGLGTFDMARCYILHTFR